MVKYIIKRLLLALLILFGVSIILYFLVRCMPTDFFDQKFRAAVNSGNMTEEDVLHIKALYGLDDSSFLGILKGYWSWLSGFLQGDLGQSLLYPEPVADVIKNRMGISFGISFVSLILELIIAIPLGISALATSTESLTTPLPYCV